MAWGYAKGFVIEYAEPPIEGKNCRNCENYVRADKSCKVSSIYPPEDGYDSWKRCGKYEKVVKKKAKRNKKEKNSEKTTKVAKCKHDVGGKCTCKDYINCGLGCKRPNACRRYSK